VKIAWVKKTKQGVLGSNPRDLKNKFDEKKTNKQNQNQMKKMEQGVLGSNPRDLKKHFMEKKTNKQNEQKKKKKKKKKTNE
jgi:hypothetical protein